MVGQRMSYPMWYNYIMKMKNEEQENLPKWGEWVMANFTAIHKEAEAKKIMRDREETITAPDGKEYPIRDNE